VSFTRVLNEIGFDPGNNLVDVDVSFGRKKINFDDVVPLVVTVRGNGPSHV
jgi:DNA-binding response OmpR family regulator